MLIIEFFKRYPPVLWALALYLCSLGFDFKRDVPLAILAFSAIYFFASYENRISVSGLLRQHWHVLFFLFVSLAATLHSQDLMHSLEVQVDLLPAILMYVIIVSAVTTRSDLQFVIVAIVVGGLVSDLSFFTQALRLTTADPLEKIYAIKSPLIVAPNDVLYFSVMAPLAVYLVFDASHQAWIRLMGIVYLAITFALTIYMQSRQGVGVFFAATFLYVALLRPFYGFMVVTVGLAGILGVDWILGNVLLKKLVYLFPRRYVWSAAWQMFLDQPVLGQGPGMFRILYQEFLEKAGYVLSQVEDRRPMNWAHSLYLEQLAERGIAGFVALLMVVAKSVIGVAPRTHKLNLLDKSLLAMMASLLLAGVAEASFLRLWTMTLVFLLLALFEVAKNNLQSNGGSGEN